MPPSASGEIRPLHLESRPDRQPRAWRPLQPRRVWREAYLASSALLCSHALHASAFHGPGVGGFDAFPLLYGSSARAGKNGDPGASRAHSGPFAATPRSRGSRKIPDPQKVETFLASKLDWRELAGKNHAQTLELYRACLALRNSEAVFRPPSRDAVCVEETHAGLALRLRAEAGDWLLLFDLTGSCSGSLKADSIFQTRSDRRWEIILSTSETRFGGNGRSGVDLAEMSCPAYRRRNWPVLHERPLG